MLDDGIDESGNDEKIIKLNETSESRSSDDRELACTVENEEEGHSNDGIDIDMADIIVIDEYDSTKKERKSRRKVQFSK